MWVLKQLMILYLKDTVFLSKTRCFCQAHIKNEFFAVFFFPHAKTTILLWLQVFVWLQNACPCVHVCLMSVMSVLKGFKTAGVFPVFSSEVATFFSLATVASVIGSEAAKSMQTRTDIQPLAINNNSQQLYDRVKKCKNPFILKICEVVTMGDRVYRFTLQTAQNYTRGQWWFILREQSSPVFDLLMSIQGCDAVRYI